MADEYNENTVDTDTVTEDKNSKFRRIAEQRVSKLLNQIRLLGNLSSANYEYSDEEISEVFDAIRNQLDVCEAKFVDAESADDSGFKFSG